LRLSVKNYGLLTYHTRSPQSFAAKFMITRTHSPHRPPHIFSNQTTYFLTASTLNHLPILYSVEHKNYFQQQLLTLAPQFGVILQAWVILDNHYHLLFEIDEGLKLGRFIKQLHRLTGIYFNKADHQIGRQVWYNYWDRHIRNEQDYWTRFNYIHYNPIKHGYVQQLRDWPFSSLAGYVEHEGLDWLNDCWRSYPIKEAEIENDVF